MGFYRRKPIYPLGPGRSPDNLTDEQFQKWMKVCTPEELEEYGKMKDKYIIPFGRLVQIGVVEIPNLKPSFPQPTKIDL
jgi:hypothetical protein